MKGKKHWLGLGLLLILGIFLVFCEGKEGEDNSKHYTNGKNCNTAPAVLYDSGQGNGEFDKMTYWHYYSLITFIPSQDMWVTSVKPKLWYCNGNCYYSVSIFGTEYYPQEEAFWAGTDYMQANALFYDGIYLTANTPYFIYEQAWTDTSIGIFTAGVDHPNQSGKGTFNLEYALSDAMVSMYTRGPVAFQLIENDCQ